MNKVILKGLVCSDVAALTSRTARFPIGVTTRHKTADAIITETQWFDIWCYDDIAVFANKEIRKGQTITIEGRLNNRNRTDSRGKTHFTTEIQAIKIKHEKQRLFATGLQRLILSMTNTGFTMKQLLEIIERKKQGIDCTEAESAEIKGWLKEFRLPGDQPVEAQIQELFPIEYGEYLDESWNSFEIIKKQS